MTAAMRSCLLLGCFWATNRRYSLDDKFSIGFKSGLFSDHCSSFTPCDWNHIKHFPAVWQQLGFQHILDVLIGIYIALQNLQTSNSCSGRTTLLGVPWTYHDADGMLHCRYCALWKWVFPGSSWHILDPATSKYRVACLITSNDFGPVFSSPIQVLFSPLQSFLPLFGIQIWLLLLLPLSHALAHAAHDPSFTVCVMHLPSPLPCQQIIGFFFFSPLSGLPPQKCNLRILLRVDLRCQQ